MRKTLFVSLTLLFLVSIFGSNINTFFETQSYSVQLAKIYHIPVGIDSVFIRVFLMILTAFIIRLVTLAIYTFFKRDFKEFLDILKNSWRGLLCAMIYIPSICGIYYRDLRTFIHTPWPYWMMVARPEGLKDGSFITPDQLTQLVNQVFEGNGIQLEKMFPILMKKLFIVDFFTKTEQFIFSNQEVFYVKGFLLQQLDEWGLFLFYFFLYERLVLPKGDMLETDKEAKYFINSWLFKMHIMAGWLYSNASGFVEIAMAQLQKVGVELSQTLIFRKTFGAEMAEQLWTFSRTLRYLGEPFIIMIGVTGIAIAICCLEPSGIPKVSSSLALLAGRRLKKDQQNYFQSLDRQADSMWDNSFVDSDNLAVGELKSRIIQKWIIRLVFGFYLLTVIGGYNVIKQVQPGFNEKFVEPVIINSKEINKDMLPNLSTLNKTRYQYYLLSDSAKSESDVLKQRLPTETELITGNDYLDTFVVCEGRYLSETEEYDFRYILKWWRLSDWAFNEIRSIQLQDGINILEFYMLVPKILANILNLPVVLINSLFFTHFDLIENDFYMLDWTFKYPFISLTKYMDHSYITELINSKNTQDYNIREIGAIKIESGKAVSPTEYFVEYKSVGVKTFGIRQIKGIASKRLARSIGEIKEMLDAYYSQYPEGPQVNNLIPREHLYETDYNSITDPIRLWDTPEQEKDKNPFLVGLE